MIQDIYPMKLDNAFEMKEPDADSRILAFRDRTVYLKNEGEITFLKYHVWVEYCKTHHKKVPGLAQIPVFLQPLLNYKNSNPDSLFLFAHYKKFAIYQLLDELS